MDGTRDQQPSHEQLLHSTCRPGFYRPSSWRGGATYIRLASCVSPQRLSNLLLFHHRRVANNHLWLFDFMLIDGGKYGEIFCDRTLPFP